MNRRICPVTELPHFGSAVTTEFTEDSDPLGDILETGLSPGDDQPPPVTLTTDPDNGQLPGEPEEEPEPGKQDILQELGLSAVFPKGRS